MRRVAIYVSAGLAVVGIIATPSVHAESHFSFYFGTPAPVVVAPPPVVVRPAPVVVAPPSDDEYDDCYWQPGHYVQIGYDYRWVPGRWIRRGWPARDHRRWDPDDRERWERDRWERERHEQWRRDDNADRLRWERDRDWRR